MDTKAYVRQSLEQSRLWAMMLIMDMKDRPTQAPTPRGGNHPLWVLGHVIFAESRMVHGYIQGNESPLTSWAERFGGGTEPVDDANAYPGHDELLGALEDVRAHTLKVLDGMSDEDFSRPSLAPEDRMAFFGTVGQVFIMLTHHWIFHSGQVADARRAAGKPPLFG